MLRDIHASTTVVSGRAEKMLPSHVFLDVLQALSRVELDAMKFASRTLNTRIHAHHTRPRSKAVVVCQHGSCFTVYDEAYSIHYVPFEEAKFLLEDCVVTAVDFRRHFSCDPRAAKGKPPDSASPLTVDSSAGASARPICSGVLHALYD